MNSVVHFEIGVKDAKTIEFYRKVFGWRIPLDNEWNYGTIEAAGEGTISGGIFQVGDNAPAGYVTVYVRVDDVAASLTKAVAEGGHALYGPQEMPGIGTIAMFSDPEGNMMGLFAPASSH